MINLQGKVVLVTGGSRGIGRATVRAVTTAGGEAVIHYGGREDAARETATLAGADKCTLVQGDFHIPGSAAAVWQQALNWHGHVDVLVNNAGMFRGAPVDGPIDDWFQSWQQTLQVNLIASAELCRTAINTWREAGTGGIIINVSSRAAARGDDPDYWAYAASKGGLEALTKTIARGYAAERVYAYSVAPGFVGTDMALDAFDKTPGLLERVLREIPMKAIAPAEDVAHTICFLASGLAVHATGTTIDINGASHVR